MIAMRYLSVLSVVLLVAFTGASPVQLALTPQAEEKDIDIISLLLARNSRWSARITRENPHFFPESAIKQSPYVLWIGCADSRVPESVVTDVMPGWIFTTRNIANQAHLYDDSVQSVIDYAVEHVGVQHIVVVGHTNCGGVTAAHEISTHTPLPPPTDPITRWLQPLVELSIKLGLQRVPPSEAVPVLTNASVQVQVQNVAKTHAVHSAWEAGVNLQIHGWLYRLEDGLLSDLNVTVYPPPHH